MCLVHLVAPVIPRAIRLFVERVDNIKESMIYRVLQEPVLRTFARVWIADTFLTVQPPMLSVTTDCWMATRNATITTWQSLMAAANASSIPSLCVNRRGDRCMLPINGDTWYVPARACAV